MNLGTNLVLVTGGLGWLGINLVKSLLFGLPSNPQLNQPEHNLTIRCLILPDQEETPLQELSKQIEIIKGDLRKLADCQRFCENAQGAILFHVAGIIHPQRVSEFYDINVQGTKNLLHIAMEAGIRRVVVMSSNSPCGCNPHLDHLFDEESPYRPYMNYGRSKMLMELAVQEAQSSGKIETVIIRSPWFYGPNQPDRQTLFFTMIRDGKMPLVGSGNNLRSMAYVDNICQGMLLAAISDQAKGQTYWIADQNPYTMNEIIDTIERLLESEFKQTCVHKRIKLPSIISEIALLLDSLIQKFGFYHQKIHVLSEMNKTIACSISKAKRELGYEPQISLEEGMRRSLQSIKIFPK